MGNKNGSQRAEDGGQGMRAGVHALNADGSVGKILIGIEVFAERRPKTEKRMRAENLNHA
jgi:hypothetical protein